MRKKHKWFICGWLETNIWGFDSFLSWTWTKAGSSKVWNGGGQPWIHSIFVFVISDRRALRLDANASQMMNTSMITAVREISEPTEEMVFHRV